jgi:hypothetical protein
MILERSEAREEGRGMSKVFRRLALVLFAAALILTLPAGASRFFAAHVGWASQHSERSAEIWPNVPLLDIWPNLLVRAEVGVEL